MGKKNRRRSAVPHCKDWSLQYIGDDRYGPLNRHDRLALAVVAGNAMDTENDWRQIMIKPQAEAVLSLPGSS